ncbi:filamentous hemagglutinin N-terminal domain-containing protein [Campylobacter sp. RKI_CA19_01121]|uniref:two-partner secretion domain-containing protein n=1 Tax=Campylobacter sp. RKI_CA19_01121 TaxID=2911626 RepID=UPI0021E6DBF6|nr:filamentous hemagglutinin N-terminal domain-containing protein [Campylobacter sp. RKI_CA19_01121]MCV3337628.1 filamentous hemagglutinin N-terminal domain-containing protein [Campylobacter sp. RKI_CA19_01121]
MKKLANHIILSGVTVSMLLSPIVAADKPLNPNQLPSGGKFTHGTSGSININGNNMYINGNQQNSVIQWGGGFSIGKDAQVHFGKGQSGQNYLNIAHGTSKSTIEGILNAGGNNVFLINPNGVIITKTGNINANRFVASTSSLQAKHFEEFKAQGASFSPVFKPQKAGNVVNMGNINANNVLLIGNKVSIDGGHINGKHNDNVSGDALKNPSGNSADKIHLVGNEVNILVDGIKSDSIIASAYVKGSLQQSTTSYYNYGNNIGKLNFITQEYDNIDKTNLGNKKLVTKDKFEKHATIGSDIDWFYFAKGWNENKNNMRDFFDTYKLVDDIDFGANCKNGVCTGQNYANYWVDLNGDGVKQDNEFTNMIIGSYFSQETNNAFNKIFDGQGYTLKNINIDISTTTHTTIGAGIFGISHNATFENINVDYMGGGIKYVSYDGTSSSAVGGFIGRSFNSKIDNISLANVNKILHISYNQNFGSIETGGFAGDISGGEISNIYLNNINYIGGFISGEAVAGSMSGGFVGRATSAFSNISLNNIGKISSEVKGEYYVSNSTGGFIGRSDGMNLFRDISIYNIDEIDSIDHGELYNSAGGFIGDISNCDGCNFTNISLENIKNIGNSKNTRWAGGFIGTGGFISSSYNFENIYLYFDKGVNINAVESTGKFLGINMSPASLNFKNIHIYHHENDLSNATTDQSYWGNTNDKINIHTYNDSTQSDAYKDFLSKANTIEKPSKPSKPTDPIDPADPDVILDDDDLYANVIMEWIINEIRGVEHTVSVEDLKKLADFINAFKGLDKDSSEAEIKAVVKTHLGIDGDKALSIAQSISFLLNYQEHNFDGRLSEKAKTIYDDIIKPNVSNTLGLISYLDKNQAYLLEQYNKYKELEQIFKDKEQAYFTAEAEFNRLLDLVNKGKLSYNDPKFTQAFDNWLNAYNSYNALSNDISDLNANVASINKGIENLGYTKFSFAKFDDITKIHLVEPKLPDIDNSQGGDLPDFEQTASLNLIGDEAVSDDEETEEVEEASLKADSKTCIVSDNYKTMNPCVVGGL